MAHAADGRREFEFVWSSQCALRPIQARSGPHCRRFAGPCAGYDDFGVLGAYLGLQLNRGRDARLIRRVASSLFALPPIGLTPPLFDVCGRGGIGNAPDSNPFP